VEKKQLVNGLLHAFGWQDRKAIARKYNSLLAFHINTVWKLYFPFEPAPFKGLDQIFFKVPVIAGEGHRIEQSFPYTALIGGHTDTKVSRHFGMCPEFTLTQWFLFDFLGFKDVDQDSE